MTVASTILEQLGGNKFIAMTGSKNFIDRGNGLSMNLVRNNSKANYLHITLNDMDTYEMHFQNITPLKFNMQTGKITGGNPTEVVKFDGVYFDQLEFLFTKVTGLDTRL